MNNNELENLDGLFRKSKEIVQVAREITGTVANLTTVISNFEIGRYLVEEEQKGELRAKYGKRILDELSEYLTNEFGKGFSRTNVASMRKFYLVYKDRAEQFTYLNAKGKITPSDYLNFRNHTNFWLMHKLFYYEIWRCFYARCTKTF